MGCERMVALIQDAGRAPAPWSPDAYVLHQGAGTLEFAFGVADTLRAAGYSVIQHAGGGGFKSQMKRADASGAPLALIVGEDELRAGEVTVKPLRDARAQMRVPRPALVGRLPEILKGG
jgi:histidyl-tRNA synthetase